MVMASDSRAKSLLYDSNIARNNYILCRQSTVYIGESLQLAINVQVLPTKCLPGRGVTLTKLLFQKCLIREPSEKINPFLLNSNESFL